MQYVFPHTIENCNGEKLIFKQVIIEDGEEKLIVENSVKPDCGPPMHTHFLQDECLTVTHGRLGYQLKGESPQFAGKGETVLFKRGVAHRFWNAGEEDLICKGWVKPANTLVFFLTSLYAAQNKSGSERPETYDGAYLLTRYASEYDLNEIPFFVKKVILPVTYRIGCLLRKYKQFKNAPQPVKR